MKPDEPTRRAFPALKLRPPVAGGNGYCGPAVVSALTGVTGGEAALVMRSISGRARIAGTDEYTVKSTLRLFNIDLRWTPFPHSRMRGRITLAGWLKMSKGMRTPGRVFLISAGHHWQLVSGRKYACGRVGGVVSIRHPDVKRRARVRDVWEVVRTGPPVVPEIIRNARAPKPRNPDRARCRALADRLGCTIEYDRPADLFWVYGPSDVYDTRDDPREGNHSCVGWGEVHDALTDYDDDLKGV